MLQSMLLNPDLVLIFIPTLGKTFCPLPLFTLFLDCSDSKSVNATGAVFSWPMNGIKMSWGFDQHLVSWFLMLWRRIAKNFPDIHTWNPLLYTVWRFLLGVDGSGTALLGTLKESHHLCDWPQNVWGDTTQQVMDRTPKLFILTRPENRREKLFKSTQSVISIVQNIWVQSETKLMHSISGSLRKGNAGFPLQLPDNQIIC